MSYTKRGPFVNASATGPWADADFFNNLETAVAASVGGVTVAPLPTGNAATDTANLQTAISTAQAALQDLYIIGSQSASYTLNAGLTWNLARGSIIGIGQGTIDCSRIPSGPALTVTAQNGVAVSGVYTHGEIVHRIANLTLFGPDADAGTVDGIYFTDVSVGDNGALEHVRLYGFRDGLAYGDNVWLVNHTKVSVEHAHRYAINGTMGANAGEMMHYYGCVFSGSANAAGTAAAFYLPATGSWSDFYFYGCSFDYNQLEADINGHFVSFIGCHFEDQNAGPMVTVASTSGQGPVQVNFIGANLADTYKTVGGRPVLVITKPTSPTDNHAINFLSGQSGNYDSAVALYQNQGPGTPTVTVGGGWSHDQGGPTYTPQFGHHLSSLADGNFESGTQVTSGLGGWALGTNADFYTALTHTGSYSLRRAGAGTTFQVVPITSRRPVSLSGYIMSNNYTSGSCLLQVQFLAADRSTVLSTVVLATISGTQAWLGYHRRMMAPQGAAYASVQWTATAYVGNAELDDVQLVCL